MGYTLIILPLVSDGVGFPCEKGAALAEELDS